MIPSVEEGKNLMLQMFAKQLRAEHPSWTFARSFAQAQSEHPDLQESFAGEEPTAATEGYRYIEDGKNFPPEVSFKTMLKSFIPERVEAAKSERPILVYGPAISIW